VPGWSKVVMTCRHDVKRVSIDPSLVGEDRDMLEDLVAAAFTTRCDASRRRRRKSWAASPAAWACRPASSCPSRRGVVARESMSVRAPRPGRCRAAEPLVEPRRTSRGRCAGLPGVGPKAAQRMALHLLQHDRDGRARARQRRSSTPRCACGTASAATRSPKRTSARCAARASAIPALLCVVETPADLLTMEQTHAYAGLYFVLMGRLSPLDGIGPREIRLDRLIPRRPTARCAR